MILLKFILLFTRLLGEWSIINCNSHHGQFSCFLFNEGSAHLFFFPVIPYTSIFLKALYPLNSWFVGTEPCVQ